MESSRFDALIRRLADNSSRRGLVGGALAGFLAGVVGTTAADGAQLEADGRGGRNRKRCRGRKRQCGKRCVNVKRDRRNCGRCGSRCDRGESCQNGKCRLPRCGKGGPCRVFITSTEHTGNLGGLAGADDICGDRAQSAGLPGTYKAWLSDSSQSPATRFKRNSGPYVLVDGRKVANNWQDLTDGTIRTAITLDENENEIAQTRVWTQTQTSGQGNPINDDCAAWTNGSNGTANMTGFNLDTDADWTSTTFVNCTATLPLYCFQQSGKAADNS